MGPLWRPKKDNIKVNPKEILCEVGELDHPSQEGAKLWVSINVNMLMNLPGSLKKGFSRKVVYNGVKEDYLGLL
jgi:hypothetical protein